MKLLIGDLHLKKATLDVVYDVLQKCKKIAEKCKETVFLGDLLNDKASIRSEALTLLLSTFSDWPTPIICLTGNHDLNNSLHPEDGHSLESLKLLPKVTVVDKPRKINGTLYIPYYPEKQFKELELRDADYLCLHQDIQGATYSNSQGVHSSIEPSRFKKFKRVISGHIHRSQEFYNIFYVGTPYTESYSEANEDKHVIILNPENNKILEIPTNVRKHVSLEYNINSLEEIKDMKEDIKTKCNRNDLLRVVIVAPSEIEKKIRRYMFNGFVIDVLKTRAKDTVKEVTFSENMSNLEAMEKYLKTITIPENLMELVLSNNRKILNQIS